LREETAELLFQIIERRHVGKADAAGCREQYDHCRER
jgi:hypothetical protein